MELGLPCCPGTRAAGHRHVRKGRSDAMTTRRYGSPRKQHGPRTRLGRSPVGALRAGRVRRNAPSRAMRQAETTRRPATFPQVGGAQSPARGLVARGGVEPPTLPIFRTKMVSPAPFIGVREAAQGCPVTVGGHWRPAVNGTGIETRELGQQGMCGLLTRVYCRSIPPAMHHGQLPDPGPRNAHRSC
jgi:hypothetical protein